VIFFDNQVVNKVYGASFLYLKAKYKQMKPTENLSKEHSDILELLGIMSRISKNIISNKVFYTSDIEEIIDFLKHFIEKSHHKKEEVFYPILSGVDHLKDKEELSVMLYEHVLARNYLKDINSCVINCKIGNSFSQELLAESMMKYVVLLKGHINKEEKIIFPMADKVLNDTQQKEVYSQFEKIEQKIVEHDFHDHYHRLLKHLKSKYPEKSN
jgi:hemerythrin-like domain-containing protein